MNAGGVTRPGRRRGGPRPGAPLVRSGPARSPSEVSKHRWREPLPDRETEARLDALETAFVLLMADLRSRGFDMSPFIAKLRWYRDARAAASPPNPLAEAMDRLVQKLE